MKRLTNLMLVALICLFALYSCKSDVDLTGGLTDIPDGEATVKLNFQFEGLNIADTRGVQGDLDFGLNNLVILFYEASTSEDDTDPENIKPIYTFEFEQKDMEVYKQEDRIPAHCEEKTYHGLVTLENVEYGAYRVYAVANVSDDLLGAKDATGKYTITEKELREIQIKWPDYNENDAMCSVPDAMFGYFTLDGVNDHTVEKYRNVIHHNITEGIYPGKGEITKPGTSLSLDHDISRPNRAKVVVLDKKHLQVQAWLKRVVSKLTIGFDGSALKPDVEIYIKSVQIVDAASTCFLGHDNSVGTKNDVESKTVSFIENAEKDPRLYIGYSDSEGAIGDAITRDKPAYPRSAENVQTEETEGTWNQAWYDYVHGSLKNTNPQHNGQPITLYFMENLQGVAEGLPKLMTHESVDHFDSPGHAAEAEECPYYKDGEPYGTYIEVKAYYKNSTFGKETEGDITYRFMLGKNETNDFNAERNCHYKLILSFLGDANDVDWHIDYEEKQYPYFRIPYNLEDGDEENGFTDEANSEVWHKNENWNHSWVWYAYNEECEPIAEICKELIYYDDNYSDTNVNSHKFYQVVTVYPIGDDGRTDLTKGIIAQVLDCDDPNEDAEQFYTKKDGAKISMYYRYQRPSQYTSGLDTDKAKNVRYTINACEITPEIAKGSHKDSHDNYLYVEYNAETKELALVEKPSKKHFETRPYRVSDKDGNTYPIVKLGAGYWFRENIRSTTFYNAEEILGAGQGYYNGSDNVVSYRSGVGPQSDPFCLNVPEKLPMYKTLAGDPDGQKYGYLYNIATISCSAEYDPWLLLIDEPDQLDEGDEAGYIVQLQSQFAVENEMVNDLSITPKDWHIPSGQVGLERKEEYENPELIESRDYGEFWQDHQYLMSYIGMDLLRATTNKGDLIWPTNSLSKIQKRNLSGISILPIPADGESQNITLNFDDVFFNLKLQGISIPYWMPSVISYKGSDNFMRLYPFTSIFIYEDDGSMQTLEITGGGTKNKQFYSDLSGAYLPIRPCRNSFPENYTAQSWDDTNRDWEWTE